MATTILKIHPHEIFQENNNSFVTNTNLLTQFSFLTSPQKYHRAYKIIRKSSNKELTLIKTAVTKISFSLKQKITNSRTGDELNERAEPRAIKRDLEERRIIGYFSDRRS